MTTAELAANSNQEKREDTVQADRVDERTPLFDEREGGDLRTRWQNIQVGFVDDPRASVEQADQLVANSIKRLAETFANERSNLESTWSRGGEVSTEDLRQALRRYRSFFDRLLAV
jgi:hypothetical protein